MNLISTFLEAAVLAGDKAAIISGAGARISFSELARRSGQLALAWRRAGVGKGDRVLVAMPVGIDLYAAIAGLWRIGATIIFPEPALGLAGLRHAVEMTQPRAFLASGGYRALRFVLPQLWQIPLFLHLADDVEDADFVADVKDNHPALISFTSGSTGKPKGIVRSHTFLAAQNACVTDLLVPTRVDEVDLVAFPVFVIANLGQSVTSVLPNWKLSRHDRASGVLIAEHAERQKVTRMLLPPSVCEILSDSEATLKLDAIYTGGGPVFPDLISKLLKRFPTTSLTAVYGSTEAEPIAHMHAQDITTAQWQAMAQGEGLFAGRPIVQTKVRVDDDEIIVTGDHVNKSYLNGCGDDDNKVHLSGAIWHKTGDAGRLDNDGFLWLYGRHSAKAGNIYPFQAEVAARNWPGVRQAALVPEIDPPVVAIEGEELTKGAWQEKADQSLGVRVIRVRRVPMDRRHRSKVDYMKLRVLADKM